MGLTIGSYFGWMAGGSGGGGGGGTNAKYVVVTGTNDYVGTVTGVTSLTEGQVFFMKVENGNTGACTANINSTGVYPMVVFGGDPMRNGDLKDNQIALVCFDGSSYQVLSVTDNIMVGP